MAWTSTLYITVMILIILYAIFSIYLKKISGLYIAACLHIILGILSLPSLGIFMFIIALLEIIVAILLKKRNIHQ